MPKDPVCGQYVDKNTPFTGDQDGETFYFCSQDCMEEYLYNNEEYTQPQEEQERTRTWS